MILIADTHVHIYSNYSLSAFFEECFNELARIKKGFETEVVACICLTESIGCNYYNKLSKEYLNSKFSIESFNAFKLIEFQGQNLYIFPGFQVNTKEKIEVLELFTSQRVESGLTLEKTISAISSKKALPVISWSFGKWLGKRGRLLESFIKKGGENFKLGDTALRFAFHPNPKLFKMAINNNLSVICGSDPLPIKGDEYSVFDYYSITNNFSASSCKPEDIADAIKKVIFSDSLRSSGKRNSFMKFIKRWFAVMFRKRRALLND